MANLVDFNDVQELSFIEEAGRYTVKIVKHERKTSQNGNDMDVYFLETKDKQSIKLYLSLAEKAMFRYKAFIRAVNRIPKEGSVGTIDLDTFPPKTIGKKIIIDVVMEDFTKIDVKTGEDMTLTTAKIKDLHPCE